MPGGSASRPRTAGHRRRRRQDPHRTGRAAGRSRRGVGARAGLAGATMAACERLAAVGHRVVHGGLNTSARKASTPRSSPGCKALVPLAPDHLPQSIAAIETITQLLPGVAASGLFRHGLSPHAAALAPDAAAAASASRRGHRAVRLPRPVVRIPRRATASRSIPGTRAAGRCSRTWQWRQHGRRARRRKHRHQHGLHARRRPGDGHAHRRSRSRACFVYLLRTQRL